VIESEKMLPQVVNAPSLEEIQHRAYELHIERGCMHQWGQGDWLQAERTVKEKY
jgi:hypothetical protein